jgi:hypothetical protein
MRSNRLHYLAFAYAGISTVSMMWITPLSAATSGVVTVDSLILTPLEASIFTSDPSTVVAAFSLVTSDAMTLPATTW